MSRDESEPASPQRHPLDDRLRVLEGHVEELLDQLALVDRRAGKFETELVALTGTLTEVTTTIRDMLAVRLRRDVERDEDRRILRVLIWWSVGVAAATIALHILLASLGATRAVSLDFRGLFPPHHSSELREAGGKTR